MSVSDKRWSGDPARYSNAVTYCNACLVNENDGAKQNWTKANCSLPVYEPGGDLNRTAVHAAAAALAGARGGVTAKPASKRAAARKLISLYRQLQEQVPDSIRRLAG